MQAFTQTNARLILGYSSVAQLGFITLGIFAARRARGQGAQGALLQAVNHGLVVAPLFFVVALLAERAEGSEDIRDYGGIAFRAPVLAVLFLIAALATLAMPGSANFAGEFLILLGTFDSARRSRSSPRSASCSPRSTRCGCTSARCTTASGRRSSRSSCRFRDGLVLVPLVLAILAFALYPQLALDAGRGGHQGDGAGGGAAMTWSARTGDRQGSARSTGRRCRPLIALTAGACIVLLVGLARSRVRPPHASCRSLTIVTLAVTAGLGIWQWDDERGDRRPRAGRSTT